MDSGKDFRVFIILALLVLIGLMGYVIYKIWHVFGAWAMIVSIVVNGLVANVLFHFIGSEVKTERGVLFNPRETPKYVAIAVQLAIGYFLWTKLASPRLTAEEVVFGYGYLFLVVAMPVLFNAYRVYRDRSDYVEIDGNILRYSNQGKVAEISLAGVNQVAVTGGDLALSWDGQGQHVLPISEMNFNAADLGKLKAAIDKFVVPTAE